MYSCIIPSHSLPLDVAMLLYTLAISLIIVGDADVHGAKTGTAGRTKMYVDQTPETAYSNCVQTIHVRGDDIKDDIKLGCGTEIDIWTGSDGKTLVAGDPEETPIVVFTDSTDTVVVLEDGECERRTYLITLTDTVAYGVNLTNDECDELRKKIEEMLHDSTVYVVTYSSTKPEYIEV